MRKDYSKLGGWMVVFIVQHLICTVLLFFIAYTVADITLPPTTYVFLERLLLEALTVSHIVDVYYFYKKGAFFVKLYTIEFLCKCILAFLVCIAAPYFWTSVLFHLPMLIIQAFWCAYLHASIRASVYFHYFSFTFSRGPLFCSRVANYIVSQSTKIARSCAVGDKEDVCDVSFLTCWYLQMLTYFGVSKSDSVAIFKNVMNCYDKKFWTLDRELFRASFQRDQLDILEFRNNKLASVDPLTIPIEFSNYASKHFTKGSQISDTLVSYFLSEVRGFCDAIKCPIFYHFDVISKMKRSA